MKSKFFSTLVIFQLFLLILNKSEADFGISRSKRHEDKTGKLTPLVVSVSTDDKNKKVKGVDLIFIVDVSGSMSGSRMTLVKESLKYMVELMNEQDSMALIKFESTASVVNGLTQMTSSNKEIITRNINNLYASGGTQIYNGLSLGLQQITKNYANGDRICSMILLSDGQDQGIILKI